MVTPPSKVISEVLPATPAPGSKLDAVEAADYLTQIRERLELRASELAQTYSPAKWLWYTRRIPSNVFAGYLITTELTDYNLLELLTGLSCTSHDDAILEAERAVYRWEVSDLVPVAQMAAIAVALGRCHGWLRRAGKGTEFSVRPSDLPEPLLDEELERAIDIFDERAASDLSLQWHPSLNHKPTATSSGMLLGVSRVVGGWSQVPGWDGTLKQRRMNRALGQFHIGFMSLDGLVSTIQASGKQGTAWWRPSTPSLVVLLGSLWIDALLYSEVAGVSLPKVGYLRRQRDYAAQMIDRTLPAISRDLELIFPGHVPASGEYVIQQLESVGPQLWPAVLGPIIRTQGSTSIVDVWAATDRLHHDVLIPPNVGGALVNASAFHFEDAVQERLDIASWRPSPASSSLRGRTLRINGEAITDIDAVAERDGTLLLVSCKNIPFTPEYNAGNYRTVRNVATRIDEGVKHWRRVLADLRTARVGDNFDLRPYSELLGIVVTPRVLYSRDASTLDCDLTGPLKLRNASGLSELLQQLGQ